MATLNLDPRLNRMRFELVPAVVSEPTFWKNYFYRVSLIKQTALDSIKDADLEKEIHLEESEQSKDTQEVDEKQVETKENKGKEEASNSEVLFDSSKSGDDSDSWINEAADLEGLDDGDVEEPENWEEELKELS
ncbi:14698_t:CDS:2, partial [Acaulospora morrowiae]